MGLHRTSPAFWAPFTSQAEAQETTTCPEMAVYPGVEPGVQAKSRGGVGGQGSAQPIQSWHLDLSSLTTAWEKETF